ncbi:hypothetical protein [Streptomyces sp. NPDC058108]|uniref:hypothetical protein n=1 Tax=Streptomyces sp. NPDC058108 TaxID=3346344 RepID=UPI0036E2B7D1
MPITCTMVPAARLRRIRLPGTVSALRATSRATSPAARSDRPVPQVPRTCPQTSAATQDSSR